MGFRTILSAVLLVTAPLSLVSCAAPPNPSFPIQSADAHDALRQMASDPKPVQRPVVLIGGWGDTRHATGSIRETLEPCLANTRILTVDLRDATSIEDAAARVIGAVDATFPSTDPESTIEVDVVGLSLGGVVGHTATDPPGGGRRLRAARLFSIAAPFRGAAMAKWPTNDAIFLELRPGSPFLQQARVDASARRYALVAYTRSDDAIVGAPNTAPAGETPLWVPANFFESGHLSTFSDNRILADIARRLRGEEPFSREPPAPLPE